MYLKREKIALYETANSVFLVREINLVMICCIHERIREATGQYHLSTGTSRVKGTRVIKQ